MKILLDECLPLRLARLLPGHVRSNKIEDISPLAPQMIAVLASLKPGTVTVLSG